MDEAWVQIPEPELDRAFAHVRDYWPAGGDGCVTVPDTPHYRAMAESGWDNTARFGADTTAVVSVDLNAQLFRYEQRVHFRPLPATAGVRLDERGVRGFADPDRAGHPSRRTLTGAGCSSVVAGRGRPSLPCPLSVAARNVRRSPGT